MSQNWKRKFTLLLTEQGGRTLDVSDLRCVFTLQWWPKTQWRSAVFKIYNLSDTTANTIQAGEFASIQIIAGYQDNSGVLFNGKIRYSSSSRENSTDTLVTIQAVDAHDAKVFATINHTLAKGYDASLVNTALMKTFQIFGITQGMTAKVPSTQYPRGKSYFGRSSNYQTQLGKQCAFSWQFINNQWVSIPDNTYINDAIVLTGKTGLIGLPQQTIKDAMLIRCLINPNIRPNSLIQLDRQSARQLSFNNVDFTESKKPLAPPKKGKTAAAAPVPDYASARNTSGFFIVTSLICQGDTMGNDWYMELTCKPRNDLTQVTPDTLSKC